MNIYSVLKKKLMFWKRKKNKPNEYKCSDCGRKHSNWPALTYKAPTNYHNLSDNRKEEIGRLNSDFCEIHYDDQIDRFIRVTLSQKVNDACENLDYGLWVSLSEKSYEDYNENYDSENHETSYFGWLSNNIPDYDNSKSIPCDVVTKSGKSRPEIFPHRSFKHQFVKDYYDGITKQEAENRINDMLKGKN